MSDNTSGASDPKNSGGAEGLRDPTDLSSDGRNRRKSQRLLPIPAAVISGRRRRPVQPDGDRRRVLR
jgi:hypothetical protein